ncbi:MAG TPA: GAF domain-containing protein, partial [Chitinophagaceae bacterium]|nr:GAF domain-containing protein [Chitinophagaceae bacterium]
MINEVSRIEELEKILAEKTAQLDQRTEELSVINSVQDGLVNEMDIQSIYDLVGNKIRDVFNAQAVIIATFDPIAQTEAFNYLIEKGERFYIDPRPYDKLRSQLIKTKQKIVINKKEEAFEWFGRSALPGTEPLQSGVFMPLITGQEVKGYISIQNVDREDAFSASDVRLLETLGNSMSVALENARHFDETTRVLKQTEQRNAELAVINSVQEGLVAQRDIKEIYELVGEKIREIFIAQVIDITTYDPVHNLIEDRYAYEKGDRTLLGPREPKGFRKHVITSRQMLVINDGMDKERLKYDNTVLVGKGAKSLVMVPLIAGGEVIGIIDLQNIDQEYAFSDSDISLLSTLANSMSVALESARLFDESARLLKETEQRKAELAVINSVQEGLAKELNISAIYELVGNRIREVFDAQVVGIATFDHVGGTEQLQYLIEKGERYYPGLIPINKLRQHLIQTGEKIVINSNFEKASARFGLKPAPGTEQPKSAIYVPLIVGKKVTSYVSLQNVDKEYAFSDSDIRLLETLANSMSVALENARLFDETNRLLKETEQRTAELAVINGVQDGLARELDIQGIYDLVGDRVQKLFDAQAVLIASFDLDKQIEHFNYHFENGEKSRQESRPLNKLRQTLIAKRQTIYIETEEQARTEYGLSAIGDTEMPKSLLFVPLIAGNEIRGYVSLQNIDSAYAFSDPDIRLLETLANSMSVALENARLFDESNRLLKETEQRNAELAVINSVQESLVAQMDIKSIYELVGEKIRNIFEAQVIDIVTYDAKNNVIEDQYAFEKGDRTLLGTREPKGFRKHVIDTGQLLLHNENVEKAMKDFGNEVLIGEMPKSQMYIPMIAGGEVKGIISLQNLDREHAFSDSDVSLITTLANSMSVALESARLFDETARLLTETEQRNAELAVINSVQESLVAQLDMQSIYDLVGEKIRELFKAQVVDIVTYDKQNNLIEDRYSYEKGDRTLVVPREPKGFRKHVINSRQIMLINQDIEKLSIQYDNKVMVGEAPKSMLLVPMIAGAEVTGIISLQNLDKEHAFSESDVSLLTTLVNSMSVALKSASLFDETSVLLKETEQRNTELAVINSVQDGLVSEMNMQGIYDLVGNKIRDVFDAQVVAIATFDLKVGTELFKYIIEKGERFYPEARPLDKLRQHLIDHRQKIVIRNSEEAYGWFGRKVIPGTKPLKSAVFVPLIINDKITSYVTLQNIDKENAFSDSDIRLLETLSNSMSVALENARLFDETNRLLKETEQRNTELAVINSVQEGLVKEMDMQGIYDLVGNKIRDVFDAQAVIIATFDHDTGMENFQYAIEKGERFYLAPRPFDKLRQSLIDTRQRILINEKFEEAFSSFGMEVLPGSEFPKSALYVPLKIGD